MHLDLRSWLRHSSMPQCLQSHTIRNFSTFYHWPNQCVSVCVCGTPAGLCLFGFYLFFSFGTSVSRCIICCLCPFCRFFFFCFVFLPAAAPPRPLPPPPPPPPQEGEGVEEQVVCLPASHCDLELYTPELLYRHRPIEAPVSPFPPGSKVHSSRRQEGESCWLSCKAWASHAAHWCKCQSSTCSDWQL